MNSQYAHKKNFKSRTMYSPHQVCFLEERFVEQDFPNKKQREDIAKKIEMTEHHVQIWFQNKRAKRRRKEKKRARFESEVTIPKAPYFWPHNLSFDSTLQEVQPNSVHLTAATTTSISSCYSSTVSTPTTVPGSSNSHCNGHSTLGYTIMNASPRPLSGSVIPVFHDWHTIPNHMCSQHLGKKHSQGSEFVQNGISSHTRKKNGEIREPGSSNHQFIQAHDNRDEYQDKASLNTSPSLYLNSRVTNGVTPIGRIPTPHFEQCSISDHEDTTNTPTIQRHATQCQAQPLSVDNSEEAGPVVTTADGIFNPLLLLADCALTARI